MVLTIAKALRMKTDVNERCVVCGKETDIRIDTHVDLRKNYIDGAGQLCDECGKIYGKK